MPKCVKCEKYYHPDYCVVIDEVTEACKCAWCYTDKKEITIEDEETGVVEKKLTKRQAEDQYKRYIHDLRYSEKVADVLAGKGSAQPKPKTN
jgi:hypothetical protein